jgi:hypothetical protein
MANDSLKGDRFRYELKISYPLDDTQCSYVRGGWFICTMLVMPRVKEIMVWWLFIQHLKVLSYDWLQVRLLLGYGLRI